MHKHAAFGGSDADFGAPPSRRRRLGCVEEERLVRVALDQGVTPVLMRWCPALDALVPKCFDDDHPEIKRSIANVEAALARCPTCGKPYAEGSSS